MSSKDSRGADQDATTETVVPVPSFAVVEEGSCSKVNPVGAGTGSEAFGLGI